LAIVYYCIGSHLLLVFVIVPLDILIWGFLFLTFFNIFVLQKQKHMQLLIISTLIVLSFFAGFTAFLGTIDLLFQLFDKNKKWD